MTTNKAAAELHDDYHEVPDVMAALQSAGITLAADGDTLIARPRAALTDELCTMVRDNKAAILAELSRDWSSMPTASLLRTARDSDSRSGEILVAVPEPEADMAQIVQAFETPAREAEGAPIYIEGVSPEFAARLSAEDLADIAAGDIPVEQVQAFETAAIAREVEDLMVILQHDAGLPRDEAELEVARLAVAYARNHHYLWASLRAALMDYPVLLDQLPQKAGPVDTIPFGLASLAVLKDKRVVRQGEFVGPQEMSEAVT